jgi:hypothetical protein
MFTRVLAIGTAHLYGRDCDLAGPKAVGRDTGGIKRKSTMTSAPEA